MQVQNMASWQEATCAGQLHVAAGVTHTPRRCRSHRLLHEGASAVEDAFTVVLNVSGL